MGFFKSLLPKNTAELTEYFAITFLLTLVFLFIAGAISHSNKIRKKERRERLLELINNCDLSNRLELIKDYNIVGLKNHLESDDPWSLYHPDSERMGRTDKCL